MYLFSKYCTLDSYLRIMGLIGDATLKHFMKILEVRRLN